MSKITKESLKNLLTGISALSENVSQLRKKLSSEAKEVVQTSDTLGGAMADQVKTDAEATAKEEQLKAEAEAKAKAEAEELAKLEAEKVAAEAAAKAEAEKAETEAAAAVCPECGGPMSEDKTCAKCGDKSKAEVTTAGDAQAAQTAQTVEKEQKISEWTYVNSEGKTVLVRTVTVETVESATEEIVLSDEAKAALGEIKAAEEARAAEVKQLVDTAVSEAVAAAKKDAMAKMKKASCSEDLVDLEFSEVEANVAMKYSFQDMVKLVAKLTAEAEAANAEKAKAEAAKLALERYRILLEEGLAFAGKRAEAQKEKILGMDEKSFASYVEDLKEIKSTVEEGEGFTADAVEKAKKALGSVALNADVITEDARSKFLKLK